MLLRQQGAFSHKSQTCLIRKWHFWLIRSLVKKQENINIKWRSMTFTIYYIESLSSSSPWTLLGLCWYDNPVLITQYKINKAQQWMETIKRGIEKCIRWFISFIYQNCVGKNLKTNNLRIRLSIKKRIAYSNIVIYLTVIYAYRHCLLECTLIIDQIQFILLPFMQLSPFDSLSPSRALRKASVTLIQYIMLGCKRVYSLWWI